MNYSSKVYYKVRWQLLQSVTAFFITKCDNLLLQSATTILLQSVTSVIIKCDRYYKVRRFYYKVRQVLQSVTIITKCDKTNSRRRTPIPSGPSHTHPSIFSNFNSYKQVAPKLKLTLGCASREFNNGRFDCALTMLL